MAGLSRAKAASIQILRTAELKASECKRPNITQFHARIARSQVAAQVAVPRPCASPVAAAWRLPTGPCPPPPLWGPAGGQQGSADQPWPTTRCRRTRPLALTLPLNTLQTKKIKFPLPHRIIKTPKAYKSTFKASSAKTFFG